MGLLTFQIFFGVLKIPDIFGGRKIDARPDSSYEEKMRVTPPLSPLWDTQPLLFNKYTILQRSSVYNKKSKWLVGLVGLMID